MQAGKLKFDLSKPGYNKQVRYFFIKLAILASIWFVCYRIILRPIRVIDRPLTNFLTASVAKCVNVISPGTSSLTWRQSPDKDCSYLIQDGRQVLRL